MTFGNANCHVVYSCLPDSSATKLIFEQSSQDRKTPAAKLAQYRRQSKIEVLRNGAPLPAQYGDTQT